MSKKTTFYTFFICLSLLLAACKKKESDVLGLKVDDIVQEWQLEKIVYTNDDLNKEFTYTPYYDIVLTMLKGGRYEINDNYSLLNVKPVNGSGLDNSKDVQKTYGSWEFTNESDPTQIVFNKGAQTYSLWGNYNSNYYYTFSDPEFVFNYTLSENKLTLTSTDYNLMYNYGFYLHYDDAWFYNPYDYAPYDDYNDGYAIGEYYGYAGGYNDGALEVYNDSAQSIKTYRKDAFFNGSVDGKLQWYYEEDYGSIDLSSVPSYEAGWIDGYWEYYDKAYEEGKKNASRTTVNPGKIELIFKVK